MSRGVRPHDGSLGKRRAGEGAAAAGVSPTRTASIARRVPLGGPVIRDTDTQGLRRLPGGGRPSAPRAWRGRQRLPRPRWGGAVGTLDRGQERGRAADHRPGRPHNGDQERGEEPGEPRPIPPVDRVHELVDKGARPLFLTRQEKESRHQPSGHGVAGRPLSSQSRPTKATAPEEDAAPRVGGEVEARLRGSRAEPRRNGSTEGGVLFPSAALVLWRPGRLSGAEKIEASPDGWQLPVPRDAFGLTPSKTRRVDA